MGWGEPQRPHQPAWAQVDELRAEAKALRIELNMAHAEVNRLGIALAYEKGRAYVAEKDREHLRAALHGYLPGDE